MIPKFLRPEGFPTTFTLERALARLTDTAPPPPSTCAWCPDFDPKTQPPGRSHGMCQACADRLIFESMKRISDPDDDDDREELSGRTCGGSCGYCGRCS